MVLMNGRIDHIFGILSHPNKNYRDMTSHPIPFQRILIPTFQTLELIHTSNIISIQAMENYSRITLTSQEQLTSTQSFGRFSSMLTQQGFFQCHKSYMINLKHVSRYHKNGDVEMTNGIKIPVARRRKETFIEILTLETQPQI